MIYLNITVVAKEYIVKLKSKETIQTFIDSVESQQGPLKDKIKNNIKDIFFFGSFKAFVIELQNDILEKIKDSPSVSNVALNEDISIYEHKPLQACVGSYLQTESIGAQISSPRHLSRISRRTKLPYDQNNKHRYIHEFNYYYHMRYQGKNVNAYVIDTGISKDHPDFEGRVRLGVDLIQEGIDDLNGHGTHVAGIIGSKTFGVAKKVNIIDVKALDKYGEGQLSNILKGIEFSLNHCLASTNKKCVANLSLGSIKSSIIDDAVKVSYELGMVMVVAAGNYNIEACSNSPASSPYAITVGAFDDRMELIAKFSNWGSCVDVLAPGVDILSLSNIDFTRIKTMSGTSMASPTVAGIVATILESGVCPQNVKEIFSRMAIKDLLDPRTLSIKPGTPNLIAFNGVSISDDNFEDSVYPLIDTNKYLEELLDFKVDYSIDYSATRYSLKLGNFTFDKR